MSLVTDFATRSAGTTFFDTLKVKSVKVLMAVWNAIIRTQEARARRFILDHKKNNASMW